jgi:hypothetical protein
VHEASLDCSSGIYHCNVHLVLHGLLNISQPVSNIGLHTCVSEAQQPLVGPWKCPTIPVAVAPSGLGSLSNGVLTRSTSSAGLSCAVRMAHLLDASDSCQPACRGGVGIHAIHGGSQADKVQLILLALEKAGCRARHMRNNALHIESTLSGSSHKDVVLETSLVVSSCLFTNMVLHVPSRPAVSGAWLNLAFDGKGEVFRQTPCL